MTMRIGELALQAGVNPQTLRYYERRGLLEAERGATSGFREYLPDAVRQVRFIRRAQDLGFTLEEIRDLLVLWPDSATSCPTVRARARATLERIDGKLADLREMRGALAKYVAACQNRAGSEACPLLEDLAKSPSAADN
jgi:DNA-binding transcriptional MerR regulator